MAAEEGDFCSSDTYSYTDEESPDDTKPEESSDDTRPEMPATAHTPNDTKPVMPAMPPMPATANTSGEQQKKKLRKQIESLTAELDKLEEIPPQPRSAPAHQPKHAANNPTSASRAMAPAQSNEPKPSLPRSAPAHQPKHATSNPTSAHRAVDRPKPASTAPIKKQFAQLAGHEALKKQFAQLAPTLSQPRSAPAHRPEHAPSNPTNAHRAVSPPQSAMKRSHPEPNSEPSAPSWKTHRSRRGGHRVRERKKLAEEEHAKAMGAARPKSAPRRSTPLGAGRCSSSLARMHAPQGVGLRRPGPVKTAPHLSTPIGARPESRQETSTRPVVLKPRQWCG